MDTTVVPSDPGLAVGASDSLGVDQDFVLLGQPVVDAGDAGEQPPSKESGSEPTEVPPLAASPQPRGIPVVPEIGSLGEFESVVAEVERTAREWGLRSDSLESKFVAALLGSSRWLGRLSEASRSSLEGLLEKHRRAAELELGRAKEITKSATAALGQARNAQIAYVVEQEKVVLRMIEKTLPLFIEQMKGVLVVREKRLDSDIQRRRYGLAIVVTLALFAGGYALRGWQDSDATGALSRCFARLLQASGHVYCDLTNLMPPPS